MEKQLRRVKQYLNIIGEQRYTGELSVGDILICDSGYKTGHTPPPRAAFRPFENGDTWGSGQDSHAWFCFSFDIPVSLREMPVQLILRSDRTGWDADNPQFMAYVNGILRQGLDTNHTYVLLDPEVTRYEVFIYGYTGPRIRETRFFAALRGVHTAAEQLYYDIRVPLDMLDYLDPHSGEYAEILAHLDRAVTMLELYDVGSDAFFASAEDARAYLREAFYEGYCARERGSHMPTTTGIGHTHIDCAWLWTLKQTREKVQRSFATVLELMKRYPEYKFMSSQAYLYKCLKEEAPALYEEVKARVREGRWEVEGAMWVEPDCNLPSGESLIRQVLYGKRFFRREFGVDSHVLWLPDVFGYSAALPQILRKSGVDWFVTSKISWNDTNTMPHDTFRWVGLDGTPVYTHFLTAQHRGRGEPTRGATYVGTTESRMIAGTWHRYQQKQLSDEVLLTFGFGDGGGGPTAEMLEMGRRTAQGIPGAPRFRIDTAGAFLNRMTARVKDNPRLPTWQGELYLEFHRGTYTSIAKNKRNNRKLEWLYLNAELLGVMGKQLLGIPFPKASLHEGWEILLTNQFHDIIPGSSIREVYEQSDIDYAHARALAEEAVMQVQTGIASRLRADGGYVVFNPHGFAADAEVVADGVTALVTDIPAKGYRLTSDLVTENHVRIEGRRAETDRFTVCFDDAMQITSLYDKACERELLAAGRVGNEIRLYADHPDAYDAWEWQEYSRDRYIPLTALSSVEILNDGARRGIRLVRPYRESSITQTIWFWDDRPRIDFDTVADWHQQHIMVKAAFPTNINADKATYEVQFGTVERPTHQNTSWDRAKFEVCAQKFADLSEGGYGVSILNDCKYGHDIHDGTITLSLLKSATYPNEVADQGEIPFVYSLYPHAGRFDAAEVTRQASLLNAPLTAVPATGADSTLPECYSAVTVDRAHVICETIKETEDGTDTIIRLYECGNQRARVTLRVALPFTEAYLCDLMEQELDRLAVEDGCITLPIGCFEILTVKLR